MRKLNVGLCIVLSYAVSWALVSAYHVEPRTAGQSGWTWRVSPKHTVSQVITVCFDEIDSASGSYCELFAGSMCRGGAYHVTVLTYPGNATVASADAGGNIDHDWVKFKLQMYAPESIVRGKKLEFRFTRVYPDSLQFYYDTTAGYSRYGQMIAPSMPSLPATAGLAMRVRARLNPIDSNWWGMIPWFPPTDSTDSNRLAARRATWLAREREAPIGIGHVGVYWDSVQHDSATAYHFAELDSEIMFLRDSAHIEIHARLFGSPWWASSRPSDTAGYRYSAPRNLWKPWPDSVPEDSVNYWARWVDALVRHYDSIGDTIHVHEIWNEPNDTLHYEVEPDKWSTGWWRRPDHCYYDSCDFPGKRGLCSLYVRLVEVAHDVITGISGHEDDLIVMGGMASVSWAHDSFLVSGKDWLRTCYEVADGDRHWNVVSAHPYQWRPDLRFDAAKYVAEAETLRAIMRGDSDYSPLWNTEIGWGPDSGEDRLADNLCEVFTLTKASEALPQGGYDRLLWFCYRGGSPHYGWSLMDQAMTTKQMAFYAYAQTESVLTGKRFNRIVGGTETDARICEFEDTAGLRTWVCWGDNELQPVFTPVPVRNDAVDSMALAYDGSPPGDEKDAENSGWLHVRLQQRPVFITETGAASRPELMADSFWTIPPVLQVGCPVTFCARVKNRDAQDSTPQSCSTWVSFWWNDSLVCQACTAKALGPGDTMTLSGYGTVPTWMTDTGLFKVDVNPGMLYVEKDGTDDNQAYLRFRAFSPPSGGIDVVVPPLRKTGAPVLPIGLASHSWERDTTGATPADSARILFAWYGQKDTVVHATDTTDWFPFCPDTTLLFPRGCGVYRVYAQFRDSGENDSPFYPDSSDSIIVFDSVPPTGSILINSGDRFTTSSACVLSLAAVDSASGVAAMRFINDAPKADLVVGGSFTATAGSFEYENGEVDTLLHMARLMVAPVGAGVRQFIPAESISVYSGDSCVLEASILAHVHDGDATGEASLWFWSTREDTSQHDTLWELVDSASYSGDLLSLTGRYNLSTRFLLETPAPESGWVWRGGMVRVQAQGFETGVGTVWTDNVRIVPYQSGSGYSWWNSFDTLVQWELESGAGMKAVRALYLDSAGNENAAACADTVILDPTAPVVDIGVPDPGQLASGTLEVTGWAYDPVEVAGDTWFESRRLSYRHVDSTNWLPVSPDSVSFAPAYPDSQQILGPAVHLGYWNTTSVPDGAYFVMLTGADSASHVARCSTWVIVANEGGGGGGCGGPEGGGSGLGEGSVYVGSATGTVLHLSDDLDSLDCFQVTDSGSQAYVTAILEVGEDSLLVLDAHNKRIHKLHKGGQNRRRLVSNLSQPAGLTRDDNGNFWLVDKGIHRIGKFRSNGTLVFIRGGLGADSLHFHSPEGIAVKGGLVYVADTKNDRIAVWDTSGNYKATIAGDFESPNAVMVTDSGSIYLTDGSDGKLKGITPLGGNIVAIGTADSSKLKGLVLSENRHYLFSIAAQPNKVYKLRIQSDDSTPGGQQSAGKLNLPKTLSLAQPFPNPARTRLNIAYALPRQTRVVLKLYDIAGKLVNTLANGDQKPGYYNLTWNRQDAKGRSCACGVYFCTLSAESKRFSRKVVLTE